MSRPECHGEYLIWRAAEGLPYPEIGEVAEILAGEYAEEIGQDETEPKQTIVKP